MVVVVKRVRTSRPTLLHQRNNADSLTTMRTDGEKSESSSSLKSNTSRSTTTSKSCRVCFAMDYNAPHEVSPSPGPLSDEEMQLSFYSSDDLKRFDKDRALTVIMYKARKTNGSSSSGGSSSHSHTASAHWDDNVHSIRGLEEVLSLKKDEKNRVAKRIELLKAVLGEQDRLKNTDAGREELALAAKAIKKNECELAAELIRGVSCSLSKIDKQKAIGLALKDEKASGVNRGSAHRLLMKVTGKIANWVNTSSKSLMSGGSDHDDNSRHAHSSVALRDVP